MGVKGENVKIIDIVSGGGGCPPLKILGEAASPPLRPAPELRYPAFETDLKLVT